MGDDETTTQEAAPRIRPSATVLGSVDLGDDEVTVRSFSDGMYQVSNGGEDTTMNAEQFEAVARLFYEIGLEKGWWT